jgi:hypothetical protein
VHDVIVISWVGGSVVVGVIAKTGLVENGDVEAGLF